MYTTKAKTKAQSVWFEIINIYVFVTFLELLLLRYNVSIPSFPWTFYFQSIAHNLIAIWSFTSPSPCILMMLQKRFGNHFHKKENRKIWNPHHKLPVPLYWAKISCHSNNCEWAPRQNVICYCFHCSQFP